MINLKKHDAVADAVKEILQQEALKGNQTKIDANHNNKIDAEDFKILRGKKKVEEELKGNQDKIDANHNGKIDSGDFKLLRAKKKMKEEAGRTEDCLDGKPKAKKGDDVGPGADGKSSKVKLKAEEVEQIDELSKDTLGSYLDKKKSEYMKGKTQSGSKENAKDIQNMGKAHDKMTLKKMKESLEEPILDELIYEVMSKDASAGDYIHDFIHSDNPKFAGKSKAKRKEMALGAYYSKKNEETVNEGLKDAIKIVAKKTFKALTGGSDKDHLDRLKKDMYGGSEVKYAAKTLVKHAKDPLGLKKEETETVEEGWDDMVKDAKEKVKSGPQPNGGSGKKQGSAYGGSKQKDKPEHDVKEGWEGSAKDSAEDKKEAKKRHMSMKEWEKSAADKKHDMKEAKTLSPGQDDAPFDAPTGTTPKNIKDKSGAVHTPMSRARNLARAALSKIKQDQKLG